MDYGLENTRDVNKKTHRITRRYGQTTIKPYWSTHFIFQNYIFPFFYLPLEKLFLKLFFFFSNHICSWFLCIYLLIFITFFFVLFSIILEFFFYYLRTTSGLVHICSGLPEFPSEFSFLLDSFSQETGSGYLFWFQPQRKAKFPSINVNIASWHSWHWIQSHCLWIFALCSAWMHHSKRTKVEPISMWSLLSGFRMLYRGIALSAYLYSKDPILCSNLYNFNNPGW